MWSSWPSFPFKPSLPPPSPTPTHLSQSLLSFPVSLRTTPFPSLPLSLVGGSSQALKATSAGEGGGVFKSGCSTEVDRILTFSPTPTGISF